MSARTRRALASLPERAASRAASFLRTILTGTAAALFLGSCYPQGFNSVGELDTVLTWQDKGRDYSELRTYDVPAQVIDLCEVDFENLPPIGQGGPAGEGGSAGGHGISDCYEAEHKFDAVILDAIHENMTALGYKRARVADGDSPDVVVVVGIVASTTWLVAQSYPMWWYYGGGYYGYWGGYYGWSSYYPWTTAVEYPTGTVVLDMLVVKEADSENRRIPSAWIAAARGLGSLTTSSANQKARVRATIDQAFAQSPYLNLKSETP